jgi:hypothetical protein
MSGHDKLTSVDLSGLALGTGMIDSAMAEGHFGVECYDKDGNLVWSDQIDNLVVNVGKNLMLGTTLAGSSYTAVVYMGLVGATPTIAATDVMSSHPGWLEVGNANAPAYSGTRQTPAFSAASAGTITTSSAASFTFTSGGTIGGAFLVMGSGASNTIDNTGGTLFSSGAFVTGNKAVNSGDNVQVSYTLSV